MRLLRAKSVVSVLLAGLCALPFLACNTGAQSTSGSTVLRIPFGGDMGSPDPANFYAVEGLLVTTNVYEGLVRFLPDSSTISPLLAEKYSESTDGLTYTFNLRSGVKFHDGTAMDSNAVKASFQRFIDVNGGPSYMLASVAQMST